MATVLVVATVGHPPTPSPTHLPPAASGTATAVAPAPSAGGSISPVGDNVPVYYLGRTRNKGLLYREYHPVLHDTTLVGQIKAALAEMLDANRALDPDYTSPWPAGTTVGDVSVSGSTATVSLSGTGLAGLDSAAYQQLVYTVTAQDPSLRTVQMVLNGQPPRTLTRTAAADVQAPVWLFDPQEGATVGRPITVHLAGIVFEGAIRLRVRSGTRVVYDQPVQLSVGAPGLGTATVTLNLPAGRYTFEAFFVSVKDGTEQGLDDHMVTVR
jgi:hypothetical protein